MKKYIIFILLLTTSSPVFAQSVFDQFDGIESVSAININKKMFELMSKVKLDTSDKETLQYMSLIKKIDNLKVYRTQNERIAMQMKLTSEKYTKSNGLTELMSTNEGGKSVRIHSKQGSSETQLKELLLFIEDPKTKETVLMSIIGDFDLNEVPSLTDKMKIPGSAELRKVGKN
jgi:hypothetical protein